MTYQELFSKIHEYGFPGRVIISDEDFWCTFLKTLPHDRNLFRLPEADGFRFYFELMGTKVCSNKIYKVNKEVVDLTLEGLKELAK